MLKVLDLKKLSEMGFVKDGPDYICVETVDGEKKTLFRIYAGSPYIRHSKTGAVNEHQIKKVYDWTTNNLVVWENW